MPPIFDDGEPTGLSFSTSSERAHIRRLLVASGVARDAVPADAPGVDVTGRLKLIDWPAMSPNSAAHAAAAASVGARVSHEILVSVTGGRP